MKDTSIIHVLSSGRRRGAEVYAVELARELADNVGEQSFFVLRADGAEIVFPDGCEAVFARPGGPGALAGVRELRSLIRSAGKRVIVVGHGFVATRAAVLAAFGLRNPPRLIHQKIGFTSPWLRRGAWARVALARMVVARVDASIAIGKGQADELVGLLRADPARVHNLPNGRRIPTFADEVERCDDLLLMVGSLSEEKRPSIAIDALAALHARGLAPRLRFVGDGPLRQNLETQAKRLGLAEYVTFTGRVDDVWPHLREATMLIICSYTEGTPGVAIEAAIAGLPVVCWEVGDVASVVENGVTGVIVPFEDEDALIAAAESLLCDVELRRRMGYAAVETGKSFDLRKVAEDFLVILSGLGRAR